MTLFRRRATDERTDGRTEGRRGGHICKDHAKPEEFGGLTLSER